MQVKAEDAELPGKEGYAEAALSSKNISLDVSFASNCGFCLLVLKSIAACADGGDGCASGEAACGGSGTASRAGDHRSWPAQGLPQPGNTISRPCIPVAHDDVISSKEVQHGAGWQCAKGRRQGPDLGYCKGGVLWSSGAGMPPVFSSSARGVAFILSNVMQNGAGKTSAIHCLVGLQPPTSGILSLPVS